MIQCALDFDKAADICRPYHGGNENSEAANVSIQPLKTVIKAAILKYLAAYPSTCDAVELALNLSHQTCSARFAELKQEGRIKAVAKAKTRTGRMADVFQIVEGEN